MYLNKTRCCTGVYPLIEDICIAKLRLPHNPQNNWSGPIHLGSQHINIPDLLRTWIRIYVYLMHIDMHEYTSYIPLVFVYAILLLTSSVLCFTRGIVEKCKVTVANCPSPVGLDNCLQAYCRISCVHIFVQLTQCIKKKSYPESTHGYPVRCTCHAACTLFANSSSSV